MTSVRAIPDHVPSLWTRSIRRVAFGGGSDDGQPPWMQVDLQESDARSARLLTQHLVGKLYECAGLPVTELSVAWVAPATEGLTDAGSFLEQAKELMEGKTFELAIVAAQIHFEAQVNAAVRSAAERDGSPLAQAILAERRSWPPQDSRARPVINALLEIEIGDFPRWEGYRAHLTRRNAVVHEAQAIAAEEAAESLDVIEQFWLWINDRTAQDSRRRDGTSLPSAPSALPTEALFEDASEKRSRSSMTWPVEDLLARKPEAPTEHNAP